MSQPSRSRKKKCPPPKSNFMMFMDEGFMHFRVGHYQRAVANFDQPYSPATGTQSGSNNNGTSTPVRRRSSPTGALMNEIRKMSLASQDAKEERQIKRFRRFHGRRRKRKEEEYTDKDRAAAVTLGSRDIKQSLKAKKKRERKLCVSIDLLNREDFLSEMLLNEATHQMRIKDMNMALSTLNKALELQPTHKAALVARSQCHLKLGDAMSALKDAETTCDTRETYITGLYQYAEALYNLGQFEKALIAYHRGYRLRRDMEGFRIGVQKSQEAIHQAIGNHSATRIEDLEDILPMIYELEAFRNQKSNASFNPIPSTGNETEEIFRRRFNGKLRAPSKTRSRWVSREVLGQMYFDKDYLTKFLTRPDIKKEQAASSDLRENAADALNYLEVREEFWRQQNPMYARKSGFNLNNKMVLEYESRETERKGSSRRPKKLPGSTSGAKNNVFGGDSKNTTKTAKINPTIEITELLK